jgi:hypothetical protein
MLKVKKLSTFEVDLVGHTIENVWVKRNFIYFQCNDVLFVGKVKTDISKIGQIYFPFMVESMSKYRVVKSKYYGIKKKVNTYYTISDNINTYTMNFKDLKIKV